MKCDLSTLLAYCLLVLTILSSMLKSNLNLRLQTSIDQDFRQIFVISLRFLTEKSLSGLFFLGRRLVRLKCEEVKLPICQNLNYLDIYAMHGSYVLSVTCQLFP